MTTNPEHIIEVAQFSLLLLALFLALVLAFVLLRLAVYRCWSAWLVWYLKRYELS